MEPFLGGTPSAIFDTSLHVSRSRTPQQQLSAFAHSFNGMEHWSSLRHLTFTFLFGNHIHQRTVYLGGSAWYFGFVPKFAASQSHSASPPAWTRPPHQAMWNIAYTPVGALLAISSGRPLSCYLVASSSICALWSLATLSPILLPLPSGSFRSSVAAIHHYTHLPPWP